MGNVQTEMQSKKRQKLDKNRIYRFLGISMANEGDGYEMKGERFKIQRNPERELQMESSATNSAMKTRSVAVALPALSLRPESLGNPGTVAELHRRCHDMLPQTFDGFRLNVSRHLSHNVAVGHALQLGQKSQLANCQFNVSYMGETLHELSGEAYPMIIAEVDAKGNLSGTLMHFITPRLRAKLTATVLDSQLQSSRLFLDYFGNSCTCTCVLSNMNVQQEMGVLVASYLQQVTPQLALGVDFIYQREDIVPGGQAALLTAVARYHQDNRLWSAMLSLQALELCYTQIYGKCLGASVQLRANILKRQAISRLCYHCYIPKMEFSFRGGIDTRGVISAVCERRLEPLPVLLQLSGKLNHLTNRFRFGLGLVIG
ncbi:mitochondrial import receptor subunit TOM40 homolog 1-like [Drosophila innubila]|uniref:mitochondrial import receptor subunit TOM40 homolog 1-like n=1 Tax=Drosophila innubila TaxID=198719 RepID=UPI00148D9B59|nr:mitochondrial import receptor subunit TOM40 homolog 1-like [Drosophila innubila]